jgi:hypothetical protein
MTDLRRVDWDNAEVPTTLCTDDHNANMERVTEGSVFVRSHLDPWIVELRVGDTGTYADLDGDGRDEAFLAMNCSNGGGTASGIIKFGVVVVTLRDGEPSLLGVIGPTDPSGPTFDHDGFVELAGVEGRDVIVTEDWYGPEDGTCCPSGAVRSRWQWTGKALVFVGHDLVKPPSPVFPPEE